MIPIVLVAVALAGLVAQTQNPALRRAQGAPSILSLDLARDDPEALEGSRGAIKIDQVGYLPDTPKLAVVVADSASTFTVVSQDDGSVVFRGMLGTPIDDPDSGDRVRAADFSPLRTGGTYIVSVEGVGRSWPFRIDSNAYGRTYYLATRSFYGQRCGAAVDLGKELPGYVHAACHREGAFHSTAGRAGPVAAMRGWHDAGDYGRYVVNSGIATGTLLWAWELFGERLKDISLDLPESANATPICSTKCAGIWTGCCRCRTPMAACGTSRRASGFHHSSCPRMTPR